MKAVGSNCQVRTATGGVTWTGETQFQHLIHAAAR